MKIPNRDLKYLSKEDREQYEIIMAKDEISEDDYCCIMAIHERLDHIIANMLEE